MSASRQLGQYQHWYWLMYLLATIAFSSLVYGTYRRVNAWRRGTGRFRDRWKYPVRRTKLLLKNTIFHERILKEPFPGLIHLVLFYSFFIFFLGTLSVMLQESFGIPIYQGNYYLAINFLMDILAVTALVGIVIMTFRATKNLSGDTEFDRGAIFSLSLIGLVLLSGLLLEGARMAKEIHPWSVWQPAGYYISGWFSAMTPNTIKNLHSGLWVFHMILAMLFIGSIPYLKLFHMLAGPIGIFFGDRKAAVALDPIDFDKEEISNLGAGRMEHFHWKQLLDTDACMSCGRCQEKCPAWVAGKPLSPMVINIGLRAALRKSPDTSEITERGITTSSDTLDATCDHLVGDVVDEDSLWSCTTCRACEVHCPVVVEHVPRIVDMRRYQVMMKGRFPEEAVTAFRGMEDQFNPWNLGASKRLDWAKDLDIPLISENVGAEYLLWMGCVAAYDQRNQKVLRHLLDILKNTGIDFAVLGTEEKCCGDPARRLGNEFLYDSLARANVETLNRYKVRKIITSCPHCFNTLKNEYCHFDGHFKVIHHSVFIHSLLADGQIDVDFGENLPKGCTVSFHDPCYLGRYNGIYDIPRQLLRAAGIKQLTELERNRDKSYCCGGGGGRMWLEDEPDKALNRVRTQEVLEGKIRILATACPYCLTMLTDGLKTKDRSDVQVLDIAEIIGMANNNTDI